MCLCNSRFRNTSRRCIAVPVCPIHSAAMCSQVIHADTGESARTVSRRSSTRRIRIHVHYASSVDKLPADKRGFVKTVVIPYALEFLQSTLTVTPTIGPIRLARKCLRNDTVFVEGVRYCRTACYASMKCGEVIVPSAHLQACPHYGNASTGGAGVSNADFLLYVAAVRVNRCAANVLAYARVCQLERKQDRPVAGHVNFCPKRISTLARDLQRVKATVLHEIIHTLGFSLNLYPFFRDAAGNPYSPRDPQTGMPYRDTNGNYELSDRVIRTHLRSHWRVRSGAIKRNVTMLVTPNVVKEVRAHFGCDTLEGGELENQGSRGTAVSHWEKRVFENEAMTATKTQNPVFTRMTLAVLQDTGWYGVNYSLAEQLVWGQELGCDFVTKSCLDWMETRRASNLSISPYCDVVRARRMTCSLEKDSLVQCNLKKYTTKRLLQYQNFVRIPHIANSQLAYYGGSTRAADYCPFLKTIKRRTFTGTRGTQCWISENAMGNYAEAMIGIYTGPMMGNYRDPDHNSQAEGFGPASMCFQHADQWNVTDDEGTYRPRFYGSGCYRVACDVTRSKGYLVYTFTQSYRCLAPGQILVVTARTQLDVYRGTIICQPYSAMCGSDSPAGDLATPGPSTVSVSTSGEQTTPETTSVVPGDSGGDAVATDAVVAAVVCYCYRRCLPRTAHRVLRPPPEGLRQFWRISNGTTNSTSNNTSNNIRSGGINNTSSSSCSSSSGSCNDNNDARNFTSTGSRDSNYVGITISGP
ncbi:Leishmanolysin-like peptidase [Lamellibrachia satsuma]|nr:Leishmanolysin-like peptidase [Lamellibrachia satsuma]